MSDTFFVWSDGGARGNPGPAGIGVVIEREGEKKGQREKVAEISEYVGEMTNNQAEYRALIRALERLQELGHVDRVDIFLDSELLVEQLNGTYRVKNADLKPLYAQVQELVRSLDAPVVLHAVPRRENRTADRLVNAAIDQALRTSRK